MRVRRTFTKNFKAEAVAMANKGDLSIPQVARIIDVDATVLRTWVLKEAAERKTSTKSDVKSPSGETNYAELVRLRTENARLREDLEMLRSFAKSLI